MRRYEVFGRFETPSSLDAKNLGVVVQHQTMTDNGLTTKYLHLVRSLMWVTCTSRPDMCEATRRAGTYLVNTGQEH